MVAILDRNALSRELGMDDLILPDDVEKTLTFELETSARRGWRFRHTLLLAGMGGTGKTSLAFAMAKELDAKRVILVSSPPSKKEVEYLIDSLVPNTVLVLDEIHGYTRQNWLLNLLEGARGAPTDQFTAFGATTNQGQLLQTVVSRFPIRLELNYKPEHLDRIADQIASRFGLVLSETDRDILTRGAAGNPRTMRNILGFWDAGPAEAVKLAQLTSDGLTPQALHVLDLLATHWRDNRGGEASAIGRVTLARMAGAPGGLADIEAVLLHRRYARHTQRGLVITKAGLNRLTFRKEKGL